MRFTKVLFLFLLALRLEAATPPTFVQKVEVTDWTITGTTNTLPAFDVVAGDALVCYCMTADVNGPVTIATSSPTQWFNPYPGINSPGSHTSVGIWTAIAATTTSLTVTCNRGGTAQLLGGACVTFRNHAGFGVTPVFATGTGTGPSQTLTTLGANSALVFALADWSAVVGTQTFRTTVSTPTSLTYVPGDGANWAVHAAYHSDTGAAGSKTIGMTAPSTQKWNMSAVEVLGTGDVPIFRVAGTPVTASATTCVAGTVSRIAPNDIILDVAESENQAIALTIANGFAEVTNSPQSAGTAAVSPANRLAVFWKRARGDDAYPTITDSGDHTTCNVIVFTGVKQTGDPWDVTAGGNDSAANDTSANIPGATTTVANTLVVLVQGTSNDATVTTNCGTVTNADLGTKTERVDSTNLLNLGGGHCVITAPKTAVGAYATSTLTLSATTFKGAMSIALAPEPIPAGGGPTCSNFISLLGAGCK